MPRPRNYTAKEIKSKFDQGTKIEELWSGGYGSKDRLRKIRDATDAEVAIMDSKPAAKNKLNAHVMDAFIRSTETKSVDRSVDHSVDSPDPLTAMNRMENQVARAEQDLNSYASTIQEQVETIASLEAKIKTLESDIRQFLSTESKSIHVDPASKKDWIGTIAKIISRDSRLTPAWRKSLESLSLWIAGL